MRKTSCIATVADVRLNPTLEHHCLDDIKKWCKVEFQQLSPDRESGGKVLLCLRKHYVKKVTPLLPVNCILSDPPSVVVN